MQQYKTKGVTLGKRLKMQRRGKGSNAYTKPPNTFKADVALGREIKSGKIVGEVIEFVDDPGHTAPLMKIRYEDGTESMLIAPEGMLIGKKIQNGPDADIDTGCITYVSKIPEGAYIYNVELTEGDGGKIARSAGSYSMLVSHSDTYSTIRLPSKQTIDISNNCRAQIGVVAGGGKGIMPIMKAGKNYYIKHAINAKWPVNRGVKSNAVDHPFGGKQHHKGSSSMVSRNAPPGAKVGHIAARRVGRKKRG
ncbi:MAG: 50S ribosomal protein L2 [Candidatus Micrarchaeia archaeon]